ncbi:MAG: branched-chain amino acid ABC transporter permease [Chloroflexota bacterium]|nr:branched-chain amino acid ABC transporter permease [Chloroflexota bacterium]MDE3192269.1 branched-chain amino acid ABC transporter permease [Chloroflexota bacterium]
MRSRVLGVVTVAAVALFTLLPLTTTDPARAMGLPALLDRSQLRGLTTISMFVVLTSAWNIIGGLAGYPSFGNVAFFGLGAYATALLTDPDHGHLPLGVGLLASPLVPAVVALVVGFPLLRLRGHYFSIATLGTAIAFGEVINNMDFLGGATGLFPPIIRSDLLFYYLMFGAAALTVGVTWWIMRSRLGHGLVAIRENEEAAAVLGVDTTRYKIIAFVVAAALTGLAGGVFAGWNSFVNRDNVFPVDYSVQMILMAVIGGSGTISGPVVGAVGLEALIQLLAGGSGVYTQILLGVLLAVTVIFLPRGVIDFVIGRSRLTLAHFRRSLRQTSV